MVNRIYRSTALLITVVGCLTIAGCGDSEEQTNSPTPTESAPAVPASVTATATPVPIHLSGLKIVFVRPQTTLSVYGRSYGELFAADPDGLNVTALAPGEEASFVGFGLRESDILLYYIAKTDDTQAVLRQRNLRTTEVKDLTSFAAPRKSDGPSIGSLSPDQRYVAFNHSNGIDVLDLETGERREALEAENPNCIESGPCHSFYEPQWSPDGTWLLASQVFYEGSRNVLIKPLEPEFEMIALDGYSNASWSATSSTLCGNEGGFNPVQLLVAQAPGWESQLLLRTDDDISQLPISSINECAWIDDSRIVMVIRTDDPGGPGACVATASTESPNVIDHKVAAPPAASVFGIFPAEGRSVVFNVYDADPLEAHPQLLDLETGHVSELLRTGDFVVAVEELP